MPESRTMRSWLLCAGACALCVSQAAAAQEEVKTEHQQKLDQLKAEAELEAARAARDKAAADRIAALGLPSFSGETKLEPGAGAMEATMLATGALQEAAARISATALNKTDAKRAILVLQGAELIDFADVGMIEAELRGLEAHFERVGISKAGDRARPGTRTVPIAGAIAAANALAGLLRSETTMIPVDLPALSDRVLANAVAGIIGARARLPAAAVGTLDPNSNLLNMLNAVADQRRRAADQAETLSAKPKENAEAIAILTAAISRFDSFFARITTANTDGVVPIARAVRLESMIRDKPVILRVFVDKAGGSLVNAKNIATMFGVDPLKVTGAVVASYTLTEPSSGSVLGADIYVCRTTLSRLRPIHDAAWVANGSKKAKALCTPA